MRRAYLIGLLGAVLATSSLPLRADSMVEIETYDLQEACIPKDEEIGLMARVLPLSAVSDGSVKAQNAAAALVTVLTFYETVFGWSSFDGDGTGITLLTNFGWDPWDGTRCVGMNAYWNGDDEIIALLIGDSQTTDLDIGKDIDVVGHELTHGVFQHTAFQGYETCAIAALNESVADMMGTAAEAWSKSDRNYASLTIDEHTYTMAHNYASISAALGRPLPGGALRNMANPVQQQHADHYSDFNSQCLWRGQSSQYPFTGITNLAFYLIAEGGRHPSREVDIEVQGIGLASAGRIIFYVLKHRLPFNTMPDFAQMAQRAAEELYGESSTQVETVHNAFAVVGLFDAPWSNEAPVREPTVIPPIVEERPETEPIVTEEPDNTPRSSSESGFQISGVMFLSTLLAGTFALAGMIVYFGQYKRTQLIAVRVYSGPATNDIEQSLLSQDAVGLKPAPDISKIEKYIPTDPSLSLPLFVSIDSESVDLVLDEHPFALGRSVTSQPKNLSEMLARDPHIGRRHCELWYEPNTDMLYIRNLNANGTWVDGTLLKAGEKGNHKLQRSVEIIIGKTTLKVSRR